MKYLELTIPGDIMPYVSCDKFQTPDEDTAIWHFMNFPEFCAILVHQKLFFTRSDCFDDPWEGSWPTYYHTPEFWRNLPIAEEKIAETINFFDKALERRKHFGVSCWHMNDRESEPFWKLYSNQIHGVAIKSTIGSLKTAVEKSGWDVNIGAIEYLDFDDPKAASSIDSKGLEIPILYKRDVFSHEVEVRAFIKDGKKGRPFKGERGRPVSIDPKVLFNEIVISPMAQDWFVTVIKGLLEKFELSELPCKRSELYDRPKFKG